MKSMNTRLTILSATVGADSRVNTAFGDKSIKLSMVILKMVRNTSTHRANERKFRNRSEAECF